MFELIKELTELTGPSGQEGTVLAAVERLWREAGASTERTRTGNLIGRLGGRGPKVLLVAHADELCYLVRAVDKDGFLWLANGQAWQRTFSSRNLFTVGSRVRVLARSGELPGVIASVTGHVATLRLPEKHDPDWDDIWVDTGLSRAQLIERGVAPGTRIVWDATTERLGDQLVGKALDDRVGVAVITEIARRVAKADLGVELTIAATVQEEIGLIGATALAAREQLDAAIVVESGLAGDVPKVGENAMPLKLGGGPALVHKDSIVHYDHALTTRLTAVADEANTPIQHCVVGSYGSDGAAFMRADVPTALITFPTRYTHTPFEMGNLGDIEAMVALLERFVLNPGSLS
jgi:putative aminopeptidase FrvX